MKNPTSPPIRSNNTIDWQKLLPNSIDSLKNSANGFNISTPSSIGLDCPSGIIDDCNESLTMEVLPHSCTGILMFSNNTQNKCGTQCDENTDYSKERMTKRNETKQSGWTKWIR